MEVQLIRNATMRWTYAGHLFLTDPYFAAKHTWPPLAGKSQNPQVDLPAPPATILADVETVLVSHLHPDHFDPVAQQLLPKDLPLLCQPADEADLREQGFLHVIPVHQSLNWYGVSLIRTPGQHGRGVWAERMGNVCGFILQAPDEPTVYWAGDTVWYEAVRQTILQYRPTIIITHSSGADFGSSGPIIMDAAETVAVCQVAAPATVIAVHLETFDFDMVSREALRVAADAAKIPPEQLRIPRDGVRLTISG
ncbi:MAG: MBL fold metallo-hydrolase [Gemmatimonadetes bacterium]|nr:MBL fold metallo-hydrolase [Gemmatimonadota bacterium]